MCDDVILELHQQIVNQYGKRGIVTNVSVRADGWHYYDVQYNNSTSKDKGLWGSQIRLWAPATNVRKQVKKPSQSWDMMSVATDDSKNNGSIHTKHILDGKRQKYQSKRSK